MSGQDSIYSDPSVRQAITEHLAKCSCTPHPYGDGPEIDCPVHGADPCPECAAGYVISDGLMERDTGHYPMRCSERCGWTN